jgi:hypothetical protein
MRFWLWKTCARTGPPKVVSFSTWLGIGLLYLPRYSPEFNPIEQAWAKVKTQLKAKAACSLEAVDAELKRALDTITAKDAQGGFRHAGYVLHGSRNRFSISPAIQ